MKKFATLLFVLTIICHTEAIPRLSIADRHVDFGRIAPLSEQVRAVKVNSDGDTPIEIHRVRACCGAKASISINTIAPSESATLTVSLGKIAKPGPFRKKVTLYTNDPAAPVVEIPIVGEVTEAKVEERENEVVIHTATAVDKGETVVEDSGDSITSTSDATASDVRLSIRLPVILLAGLVDGFNPCSFAIMISLAGILAIGGRKRRARIIGGLSFCLGSFVTYMLMGLGLMQALKALSGLRVLHNIVMSILALTLFALSFLSFRDALRFHKIPVFSVVTLKLPEGIKYLIRQIAISSWSGPAVAITGFGCAFLVTLLDALCTGQVYVPVLALLAKEQHSIRALVLLALYNLAFVAPLVAVFVLTAKTTDAFQMAKWSSRNVVPSKIFLGLVFALLGYLLWPDLSSVVAETEFVTANEIKNNGVIPSIGRQEHPEVVESNLFAQDIVPSSIEHMTDAQLSEGNEFLDALVHNPNPSNEAIKNVIATICDQNRDPNWRNYCLQIVPELIMNIGAEDEQTDSLWEVLEFGLSERTSVLPGTALLGIDRLNENGHVSDSDLINYILVIAADENTLSGNRITALRLGAERGIVDILPISRRWAKEGEDEYLIIAAISAISEQGGKEEIPFLQSLLPAKNRDVSQAMGKAIHTITAKE